MTDSGSDSGCGFLTAMLFSGILGFVMFFGVSSRTAFDDLTVTPPVPTVEIVLAPTETSITAEQMDLLVAALERRLAALAETAQIAGGFYTMSHSANRIIIGLTEGALAADEIAAALIQPGYLEFVDFSAVPVGLLSDYAGKTIVTSASVARTGDDQGETVFPTVLTHEDILRAEAAADEPARIVVQIDLTADAAAFLGEFSEAHIGSGMAIVLDGVVLTVPVIRSRIETPVIISGNFTETEVQVLAAQINSQPLPVALTVEAIVYLP